MNHRIDKARAAILMFLVFPRVLAYASPFDGLPTPRVPGFGGFMPILDGVTKLQLSLNAALGKGLFAYADGLNLQVFLSTLAIAIAYGAVHALSPGHGKTLLLVHGLRMEKLDLRALLAPCLGAFLHVFSAIFWTTLFTVIATGAFGLGRAGLSIALLVFSSLILLLNGLRELFPGRRHAHDHDPIQDHPHNQAQKHGWLAVALGIGLIPCPISTIIFSAALGNGLAFYGIIICLLFGFGLALTMTIFALVPLFARNTFTRFLESLPGRIVLKVLPIVSSLLFMVLGVMGIFQAIAIA